MKLSPRCPIATSELCYRYYSSYYLLGKAGVTTKISDEDKERLDQKWASLKPVVVEEEAGLIIVDGKLRGIYKYCPEVTYNTFGLFASGLHRYSDEIDKNAAEERLALEKADPSDPRWNWASIVGRHYTECREYSLFREMTASRPGRKRAAGRVGLSPKMRWEVFCRDDLTCVYCGRKAPEVALEVDHRISVANGGGNEMENLVTACVRCNRGKGAESR